ncbi:hypothetical protein CIW54_24200 [Paraburkholderia sp. T12-10]|nr:hypothetical protein CIW54_24200 [Paraburkholderia sp. T12-10]
MALPLEPTYPVVLFDALRVKIREDAVVFLASTTTAPVLPHGMMLLPANCLRTIAVTIRSCAKPITARDHDRQDT